MLISFLFFPNTIKSNDVSPSLTGNCACQSHMQTFVDVLSKIQQVKCFKSTLEVHCDGSTSSNNVQMNQLVNGTIDVRVSSAQLGLKQLEHDCPFIDQLCRKVES